jgi:hypothetical protein
MTLITDVAEVSKLVHGVRIAGCYGFAVPVFSLLGVPVAGQEASEICHGCAVT